MKRLSGKCFCGAVAYAVEDAFVYAAICHCSNCRRTTGSAFKPFAGIPREKLALTKGADSLLIYGGPDNHDAHCRACGSLLYSLVREAAWVHVAMERSRMRQPSDRHIISSSALRRRGTRSPTTCRNMRGTRAPRPWPPAPSAFRLRGGRKRGLPSGRRRVRHRSAAAFRWSVPRSSRSGRSRARPPARPAR